MLNDAKTNNCGGSVDTLSKEFAKQLCNKLKTEGVKDSIHEGFEPAMNIQEVLEKSLKVGIEQILQRGPEQSFADFYPAVKEQAVDALGKSVEELEDGFVNGEADVLKFIEYNIEEYNKATAGPPPPGDNGMAERMLKMKSAQQLAMVNKGLAAYKAAKGGATAQQQPTPAPVAAPVQAPVAAPAQAMPPNMVPGMPGMNMMSMMRQRPQNTAANVDMKNEEDEKDGDEAPSQHEQNMRLMQEKFGAIIKADK